MFIKVPAFCTFKIQFQIAYKHCWTFYLKYNITVIKKMCKTYYGCDDQISRFGRILVELTNRCCSRSWSASSFSFLYKISISVSLRKRTQKKLHHCDKDFYHQTTEVKKKKTYFFSISCFMSMPCFSKSSL